jgi:hypothetical protein
VASLPGVEGSIDVGDAVGSYYRSLFMLNPSGIVPKVETDLTKLFA